MIKCGPIDYSLGSNLVENSKSIAAGDLTVDTANLYREDSITDLRLATIRRLTPIRADGTDDPSRPIMYIGDTTLGTQLGPLPIQFAIEAATLQQACDQFPEGVRKSIEQLNERAREMARDEASRIVVPGAAPGRGNAPFGVPPGGKLVLK